MIKPLATLLFTICLLHKILSICGENKSSFNFHHKSSKAGLKFSFYGTLVTVNEFLIFDLSRFCMTTGA